MANDPVVGLRWQPAAVTLAPGASAEVHLLAVHQSGRESDVTFDPRVQGSANGPIQLLPGQTGIQVLALSSGVASIDAFYLGFNASLTITITGMMSVVRVEIVLSQNPISVGGRATMQALAAFADGSIRDVTFDPALLLSASPAGVIAVQPGVVFGQSIGTAALVATFGGVSGNLRVEVSPTAPVALLWQPGRVVVNVGSSRMVQILARLSDGSTRDVSSDPQLALQVQGPVRVTSGGGGVRIEGLPPGGPASVEASMLGLRAVLQVVVQPPSAQLIRIRMQPSSLTLDIGQSQRLTVIGEFSDGTTRAIQGAQFTSDDPQVAGVDGTGMVIGVSFGQTRVRAQLMGFTTSVPIDVQPPRPQISSVTPDAIPVGSPGLVLDARGTGLQNVSNVTLNGRAVAFFGVSATRVRIAVLASFFSVAGTLELVVTDASGQQSAPLPIEVGEPPSLTLVSPEQLVAGASTWILAAGSGLGSVMLSGPDLQITSSAASADGTTLRALILVPSSASPGARLLTARNRFGQSSATLTVIAAPSTDLIVGGGQTRILSGTQAFRRIIVENGGRIIGAGMLPLTLLATGEITVRGLIDVSGRAGDQGSQIAGDGGDAGPGGAGGGAAGDGDTASPPVGGAGAPPGFDGVVGQGAGTPAGAGGGAGGGAGAAGGCARAGGGGGLDGRGGNGGSETGAGTGGRGGAAGAGSDHRAGTGGGGGSTCGPNSGGGGGGGGGSLLLQSLGGAVTVAGEVRGDGGAGGEGFQNTGAGGGGSGGRITVLSGGGDIEVTGRISARGGPGGPSDNGSGGGGGAGGRIQIDASPMGTHRLSGALDALGGAGGMTTGGGAAGTAGAAGNVLVQP